jgi:hypothetical protein
VISRVSTRHEASAAGLPVTPSKSRPACRNTSTPGPPGSASATFLPLVRPLEEAPEALARQIEVCRILKN